MTRRTPEMIQFDEELGRRIEMTRRVLRMKAKDLAAAVGVHKATLWGYECGRSSCPPAMVVKIAMKLGVSVNALMPKFEECKLSAN